MSSEGLSRRKFVQDAGMVAAGVVFGSAGHAVAAAPKRRGRRGRRVAVFGAGPAGMTIAHELAERGFSVDVYERNSRLGGGVRSFVTSGKGTGGRPSLPNTSGAHGLLPGYAAVPDMMSRIPTGDGRHVIDHLAPLLTGSHGNAGVQLNLGGAVAGLAIPTSPDRLKDVSVPQLLQSISGTLMHDDRISPADVPLLASKVAAWVTCGPQRRRRQLEFIDLEYGFFRSELMSPATHGIIRLLCSGTSLDSPRRHSVNTPKHGMSALTYLTTVLDQTMNEAAGRRKFLAAVHLTDGPETEVWFDPWARYLEGLGVRFHTQRTLTKLGVHAGRITGAAVSDVRGRKHKVEADWYVTAMPASSLRKLLSKDLIAADPALRDLRKLHLAVETGFELFFREPIDFTTLAVTNKNVDESWLLFGIAMSEIWGLDLREYGDGNVRGMISLEFNNHPYYNHPGIVYGKPLKDLNQRQTLEEVKAHIIAGVPAGADLFANGNFVGWRPHPTLKWSKRSGWSVSEHRTASAPGTSQYFADPVRKIPNLFVVGGHTKTPAGSGDCMETASLSGKIAANGIVDRAGVNENHVQLADYRPPRELKAFYDLDDQRFRAGLPNVFDTIAPARMPAN